jgi:hypothetical protein
LALTYGQALQNIGRRDETEQTLQAHLALQRVS